MLTTPNKTVYNSNDNNNYIIGTNNDNKYYNHSWYCQTFVIHACMQLYKA